MIGQFSRLDVLAGLLRMHDARRWAERPATPPAERATGLYLSATGRRPESLSSRLEGNAGEKTRRATDPDS